MTKVTLVISKFYPEYTGAARRLETLYKHPDFQNIDLDIICNSTELTRSENFNHGGWRVHRRVFPFHLKWLPQKMRYLLKTYYEAFATYRCLRNKNPDLIHIAGTSGGTMAAILYGKIHKLPRLIELVTKDASPAQYLPGLRYALNLESRTASVAISQDLADRCAKIGLKNTVWSRPNPVDETKFSTAKNARETLRKNLTPFSKGDTIIAMVAKFMPQKNQIFLLDVLAALPEQYKLLLAGPKIESGHLLARDQEYFQAITDTIDALNLKTRVHIQAGFVEASDYMKAADIYAMPQYDEGLGTPMLEAIVCGLPVIANENEPAFRQWIKDGENGYLCANDPSEWAQAIEKAIQIPKAQKQKAAKDILAQAGSKKITARYVTLINQLVKMKPDETLDIEQTLNAQA